MWRHQKNSLEVAYKMRTLYLECGMGAAGDMLTSALLDLFKEPEQIIDKLNRIGIPKVKYVIEDSEKCGIKGMHVRVLVDGIEEAPADMDETFAHKEMNDHMHNDHIHNDHMHNDHMHNDHIHNDHIHNDHMNNDHMNNADMNNDHMHDEHVHDHQPGHHAHHHSSMHDIENIIQGLDVNDNVKKNAVEVYKLIAEAESKVHGKTVDEIHFHEVGSLDAVADVVAVCYLIDGLNPDNIIASPVRMGYGHVHCAHGILPVPAPATALILQKIPVYAGELEGEFCTPTGAALLKHFVTEYGNMPVMSIENTGYGMGSKNFTIANCLRAYIGENADSDGMYEKDKIHDKIIELRCNLDDMAPEDIAYATELLMDEGACDVYTLNIQMKKNRPGIMLCCMCKQNEKEKFAGLIFKHTSTIGIREYECNRYILKRENIVIDTGYGKVQAKKSEGYGTKRVKAEYEDIARIAKETGLPISEVRKKINI